MKKIRIQLTMTDYCYRNYKMYLQEAIVHDTYSETMGGLIRKNLKCTCIL